MTALVRQLPRAVVSLSPLVQLDLLVDPRQEFPVERVEVVDRALGLFLGDEMELAFLDGEDQDAALWGKERRLDRIHCLESDAEAMFQSRLGRRSRELMEI